MHIVTYKQGERRHDFPLATAAAEQLERVRGGHYGRATIEHLNAYGQVTRRERIAA